MHGNLRIAKAAQDRGIGGNLGNATINNKSAMPNGHLPHVRRQRERLSLIGRIARKLKGLFSHTVRQAKHWLAKGAYSLPFLSRRDQRTKVIKFKDHCRVIDRFPQSAESIREDWYLRVRSSETIQRQSSICLYESEVARFRAGTAKYQNGDRCEIPEVFLACFHDARIEGRDFLVLTQENQIVFESALSSQDILEENGILDTLIRSTAQKLSGTYVLLGHPWAWGYYHWLIEVLPKLSLIENFEELESVPLIVPHQLKSFQRESLRMAGVSTDRMVHLEKCGCRVDRLFFPEIPAPSGIPSPHAVRWLRKRFLKVPQESRSGHRIYLTRSDATQRRVLNEEQIIEYLQEEGFKIVCPGELSISDQVEMFRDVEIVIAPHGAGATNMVFSPSSATLIELFGDNYINGCYWALANICGQTHAFLTGPSEWLDYSIALDDLKALLEKLECFESGDKASKASATPA
jgi:capsular polysaccharide biosynthesis protein